MAGLEQADIDKRMMAVIVQCTEVQSSAEFSQLIEGPFRAVVPHEIMTCGIGGVSPQGNYIHKMLNHGYPLEYFDPMLNADGRADSPLMKKWRETHEPVIFQSGRDDHEYSNEWV